MPAWLEHNREVLEALNVTGPNLSRNLALAELSCFDYVLPQALAAMREMLEADVHMTPVREIVERLGTRH